MSMVRVQLNSSVLTLAGVATLLLLIFAFFYFQEWVTIPLERGFSPEATRDSHFAMSKYLEKREITFTRTDEFTETFENSNTRTTAIYLPVATSILAPVDAELVLDWVQRGGTLLYNANRSFDDLGVRENDPILEAAGIQLNYENNARRRQLNAKIRPFQAGCTVDEEALRTVNINGERLQVTLSHFRDFQLIVENGVSRITAIQANRYGAGWVVAVPSSFQWSNFQFFCNDNARLAYQLINYGSSGSAKESFVWIKPKDYAWLTDRLWENYPASILLLLAIFLLWVRKVSMQHLRQFPVTVQGPRSIIEYVQSISHLQWRTGAGTDLLENQRNKIRRQVSKQTGSDDIVSRLAERSELTPEQIRTALQSDPGRKKRTFIEILKTLNLLRRKL